jgi:hypothetical protein
MAITVKHSKTSAIPDAGDATLVQPSDWNADHTLTGTIPVANGGTGASTLTGYVKGSGTADLTASATIPNTDITGLGTASTRNAGSANGVATLDSGGKVPVSELPAAVLGALSYQGTWNASTNTPTLVSSVGTKGYYYVVSVAGSTNLDGITDWKVGDWAVYNGTAWQKVDNTDSVTSVNGYTGTVVLTNTDISGFGTMSTQNANAVAITGGTINATTIGATTATTGAFTTATASTSVTTPIVQATNSAGLALKNSAGTTQMSMGAGGCDNLAINVATNINCTNAQIDIIPTGTGHVHINPTGVNSIQINPTYVGTMDNITIGATTPKNASVVDLSVTGTTSFDGSQGTAGQVLTSAGTGATPTWTTPTTGTVTSVTGTAPVVSSGGATPAISMAAATGSVNGYLTSTDWTTFNNKGSGTVTAVSVASANGFAGTSSGGATPALTLTTSITGILKGNGAAISAGTAGSDYSAGTSALSTGILKSTTSTGALTIAVAADFPTLNQNTTGSAGSVANALTAGTGLTATATYNGSAAITFNATGTTINSQTTGYTLVATDAGKTVSITTGGVTIPNAVMSAGNIVSIYNNSGSSQTITQGTSLTLQWAGQSSSSTGNRTLGLYGLCTIVFISSSNAVITGSGLT